MPVMTLRGKDLETVCSVMGGKAQPQVHTQVLLHGFAGRSAAEAVAAPRWIVGPLDPTDPPDGATVESDHDGAVAGALEAAGFTVRPLSPTNEDTGQVNLIHIGQDGELSGAADSRADGTCVLVETSPRR
jgi:gamma-glutamyltranspeptidase